MRISRSPAEFSRLFVNYFTQDSGISVHAGVTGWQPISGWRRANFNIRGWQGRWRHTAPTTLFFLPSPFPLQPSMRAPRFIPFRRVKFLACW
jgi:hypothetical protein